MARRIPFEDPEFDLVRKSSNTKEYWDRIKGHFYRKQEVDLIYGFNRGLFSARVVHDRIYSFLLYEGPQELMENIENEGEAP